MERVFECNCIEDTEEIAKRLAAVTKPGAVIALDGDLGCGKTAFTKGFAKALGVKEPVVSPTFTIFQVYEDGALPLYHFDVYRIEDPEEMYELGYEEYFYSKGVTVVEWADMIKELIPANAVHILMENDPAKGFDYRKITISCEGELSI